jgi:hypothetical protein
MCACRFLNLESKSDYIALVGSRTFLNHSEYKLIHIEEEEDDNDVGEH